MDFLSLVIESAAAANHSAGTTEIEYPLLASCQFFGSKRKNGLENRDGSEFSLSIPASLDVHARLDQKVIMRTLYRAVLRRGQEQHRNRRSRRRWIRVELWQRVGSERITKMADSPDTNNAGDNDMREEYDFQALQGVVRGKYAARYAERLRVVRLDADIADAFPDEVAVNAALRQFLAEHPRETAG